MPSDYDPDSDLELAFDPELSMGGTFLEPDEADRDIIRITFGSGYLEGYFVEDQCTIGDISEDADSSAQLVLDTYTFGMVTE